MFSLALSSRVYQKKVTVADGIINQKVIALGGMDNTTIPLIEPLNFGGVAVLGALWGDNPSEKETGSIIERYKQLNIWR